MPQTKSHPTPQLQFRNVQLACAAALLLSAAPAPAEEPPPPAAAASPTVMLVPWGNAQFTVGDFCWYPWPDWSAAAFKDGGAWNHSEPAWEASAGTGSALRLELDREALETDLALAMWCSGGPGVVQLFNDREEVIAANLAAISLGEADGIRCVIYPLGLADRPEAVGVLLANNATSLKVYATMLFPVTAGTDLQLVCEEQGPEDTGRTTGAAPVVAVLPVMHRAANAAPVLVPLAAPSTLSAQAMAGGANGAQSQSRTKGRGMVVRAPASGSRILW